MGPLEGSRRIQLPLWSSWARQDEQFSEARVEFKNIDNRFEEVRGQMHAMQHNLGH